MKCKNCGKGRPRLWTADGSFCNQTCHNEFKSNLTKKERKVLTKNLEEDRRAIQHIVWGMNHPDTKILIPRRGEE